MDITAIGIDPGNSGGIALIPTNGYPDAYNMPTTHAGILSKLRGIKLATDEKLVAFYEVPPKGVVVNVKTTRRVLYNQGAIEMALEACDIEAYGVTVSDWQNYFDLYHMRDDPERDPITNKIRYITGDEKKRIHVKTAEHYWPYVTFRSDQNRFLDGRADAMMIADYGLTLI